jgi:hypothetical protein
LLLWVLHPALVDAGCHLYLQMRSAIWNCSAV